MTWRDHANSSTDILTYQDRYSGFPELLEFPRLLMLSCTQPVRGVTEMVVMIITRVGWDDWLLYNFQDRLYESRADPSVKSYSGRDSAGHLYWRCNTERSGYWDRAQSLIKCLHFRSDWVRGRSTEMRKYLFLYFLGLTRAKSQYSSNYLDEDSSIQVRECPEECLLVRS